MIKRNRVLSCLLTFCMLLVMSMGLCVFALESYSFSSDSVVVENISVSQPIKVSDLCKAMGGNTESYVDGKTSFNVGTGILSVTHKGIVYDLIKVADAGSGTGSVVSVNVSAFRDAKQKYVISAMRVFVDALGEVVDSDVAQQVMQGIQDSDTSVSTVMLPLIFDATKADLYTAYTLTSPFLSVLNVVLCVVAVLLLLLIMFSTGLDMIYIGVPIFRVKHQNRENAKGSDRPFGVSFEAVSAVDTVEQNTDGTYKSVWFLYFRRRALSLILVSICLVYLIGGGLTGIISFILSLTSGFQM